VPPEELRILSRASPLATAQVEEALEALAPALGPGVRLRRIVLETPGDRDLSTPLTDPSVADDFFTRDLDQALLRGEADLAVHSAKDLPKALHPDLVVAARLPARDIRDALVFRAGFGPDRPPAVIGTSSPRREAYLRRLFPGARLLPIRGTIGQRLEQLDAGLYDAVVMAACALVRLGRSARIGQYVDADPEPDQGRLAVTARRADGDLVARLGKADVLRRGGLVVILRVVSGADGAGRAAEAYLAAADVVVKDAAIGAGDVAARPAGCPVVELPAEAAVVDRHRALLAEAERGRLTAYLYGGDEGGAEQAMAFLQAWGIRSITLAGEEDRSPSPRTLFVGTDPTPFLRHGPLQHFPLIACAPRPLDERRNAVEALLREADGVLFPSRHAVRFFLDALPPGEEAPALAGKRLLAVGPATAAELASRGFRADYAPASFGGIRELAGSLPAALRGVYLYPCSDAAPRAERTASLARHGISLLPSVFYTNRPTPPRPLPTAPFARVLFTSSSTVRVYFERYPEEQHSDRTWIAVGPATREALEARGLRAECMEE
jgi:hydroxymethylbilane synthase